MNNGQELKNDFKEARRTRLQSIPKVELHRHLDCSMRLETMIEISKDLKMPLPQDLEGIKDLFLVRAPMLDLDSVLRKFLNAQAVLHSEEVLTRLTFEAIEDAVNEGIKILELRFAPSFIIEGHPNLTFEKVLDAIKKGAALAQHLPIAVGFICIIQRTLPISVANQIVDLTIENKDFFVGLDLADNEVGFDPLLFQDCFWRAREAGIKITVHAGEALIPQASLNVKNAIEILGAQRIGHGLQIATDPFVTQLVKKQAIPLELCLTSNWLTQAIPEISAHPIKKLMESDVPVTINSDDPGIFGIDLVHEYELLETIYGFTETEFQRCNDIAAQASFLPLLKKQKYWPRPIHLLR